MFDKKAKEFEKLRWVIDSNTMAVRAVVTELKAIKKELVLANETAAVLTSLVQKEIEQ